MGVNLSGVEAFSVGERLSNGTYLFKPVELEKGVSAGGHPDIRVEWRVDAGDFKGADQKAWITFSPRSGGAIVQLLNACDIPTPQEDFDTMEALRDWVYNQIEKRSPRVLGVVRVKPSRKDPSKEFPEIEGYRKPTASDIPDGGPVGEGVKVGAGNEALPF